jgi:hypothetical protein
LAKKSFEYDLGFIRSSVEVLESYLLSDEVFWQVSGNPPEGSPDYPRLTLGNLLLSETRLNAYSVNPDQEASRQQVESEVDRLRTKWRVRWEMKAAHSFGVRLRMWGDYLEEYSANPQENSDRYAYEVRLRVILELLKVEGGGQPVEVEMLAGLDKSLRSMLEMTGFIWEPEVQSGFSEGVYWYLYGTLPRRSVSVR